MLVGELDSTGRSLVLCSTHTSTHWREHKTQFCIRFNLSRTCLGVCVRASVCPASYFLRTNWLRSSPKRNLHTRGSFFLFLRKKSIHLPYALISRRFFFLNSSFARWFDCIRDLQITNRGSIEWYLIRTRMFEIGWVSKLIVMCMRDSLSIV